MAFKRIISPVDFSNSSLYAFQAAVEMARRDSAELLLLHVVEGPPIVSEWFPPEGLAKAVVQIEESAHQAVETLLARSGSLIEGLSVSSAIVNGVPFVEILKQATAWKADLIVLGAVGAASLDQIIFGSTAERVLKGSRCSVLVVKSE